MLGCHFLLWSELCRNRAGYVFRCVAFATHFFIEGEEPIKKKIILFLVSTVMAVSLTGCKSGDYNEAVKLQEAGDYQVAL